MSARRYPWIRKHGGVHALIANPGCAGLAAILIGVPLYSMIDAGLSWGGLLCQLTALAPVALIVLSALFLDPRPTIAPYFRQSVGAQTYSHGAALAQAFPQLDQDAEATGVRPPSEFGFEDDFRGGTPTWHDPTDGLRTFLRLLEVCELRNRAEEAGLRDDLRRVVAALDLALAQDVEFCLVLPDSMTCQAEHDARMGSFF